MYIVQYIMYGCPDTQLAGSLYVHVILGMHYELQEVIYFGTNCICNRSMRTQKQVLLALSPSSILAEVEAPFSTCTPSPSWYNCPPQTSA